MTQNPFKDSKQRVQRRSGDFALGVARVVEVPDDGGHQIAIRPTTKTGTRETDTRPSSATVLVAERGDISLPEKGDLVIFGRLQNRKHIVLGTLYSQEAEIRSYRSDERHVGDEEGGGVFIHGPFGVVPKVSVDPADAPDGAVWYRSDLGEYRGVEDGTTVSFDTTAV